MTNSPDQLNRPSANPGGMECHSCGRIFIGDQSHDECGICHNTRHAQDDGAVAQVCYDSYGFGRMVWLKEHGKGNQPPDGSFLYTHPPRSEGEAPVVKLGRELFRFDSFEQWVNKAQSWFKTAGVSSTQFVCIDATGHICGMGKQFMSARDRNAFPVIVYHIEPEQDAAMSVRGGE